MISCSPDMAAVASVRADPIAAARFFRVLGDPTRLDILELLIAGERAVGAIVRAVGQPQPRVSTHLACLRHCGFVATERRGREVYYRLAVDGLGTLLDTARPVIAPLSPGLSTCQRIGPDWI